MRFRIDFVMRLCIIARTMKLNDLITHFGTQKKAASAVGVSQAQISRWHNGIPYPRQCQIQLLTGGLLVADQQKKEKVAA